MKYITRVHTHGSEIFQLALKDEKTSELLEIIKSATTEAGINSIISEHKGILWYNERSKNKIICNLEKVSNSYQRIKISPNKGFFNIPSNKSYIEQKKYIDLIISHYIEIWQDFKGRKYAPLHGDLSLVGNVMFNYKNEVLFVDWEQFDNNENMPTGTDPIMTILENVWYEIIRSKKLHPDILKHIVSSITILKKAKLISPLLFENPVMTTLNFIKSNSNIWNGQYFKLPVLRLSEKHIRDIDKAISQTI